MSASKLPVRRNIAPLFKIANDLEDHLAQTLKLKNDKIYKKFSANFDGQAGKSAAMERVDDIDDDEDVVPVIDRKDEADKVTRKNWKSMLQEKDEQIDKLVDRLTQLHEYNTRFAAENEKLQNQHCESCQQLSQNEVILREHQEMQQKENQQLRDDVKMMKTLVYRLNVQLERHQDLLRQSSSATDQNYCHITFTEDEQTRKSSRPILDWGRVHAHTLGPLLQAYTEIISDKNDLVQQYENELGHFTGRLKDIIEENEKLHEEMDEMRRQGEMWTTDKTRLQAQLDICRNKAEVQSKRADLAKEKLVEVLRCYEQKVQSQHLDLERLQEAYARSKGELTAIRSMQQSPEVVVESLKECQKLFEDLKGQHDNEKTKLLSESDGLRSRLTETEERMRKDREECEKMRAFVKEKEADNDSLNKKNAALRQSLARVRLSRESFRNRLKHSVNWTKNMEGGQRSIKESWQELENVDAVLRQKENQVQNVHTRYLMEIEKLTRKLEQRDDTLKKVLQAKIRSSKPMSRATTTARKS